MPILTVGMPILFYLIVKNDSISYKKLIKVVMAWALGYATIWATKWIVCDLLYKENIIQEAMKVIKKRSGSYSGSKKLTLLITIIININDIKFEALIIFFITIFSIIIDKIEKIKISNKEILQYLFIALIPIIWYTGTKNHSCIHPKYTYRDLFITILSCMILDYKILKQSLKLNKRREE